MQWHDLGVLSFLHSKLEGRIPQESNGMQTWRISLNCQKSKSKGNSLIEQKLKTRNDIENQTNLNVRSWVGDFQFDSWGRISCRISYLSTHIFIISKHQVSKSGVLMPHFFFKNFAKISISMVIFTICIPPK